MAGYNSQCLSCLVVGIFDEKSIALRGFSAWLADLQLEVISPWIVSRLDFLAFCLGCGNFTFCNTIGGCG
ncbi:MAG: hypothetical protein ACK2T5_05820 [Anaerolineales bacterium]